MWNDFKKFAFKGNIIDMSVGVIVGGAFGKIVTALVNNIITPLISLLIGKVNFSDLKWVITPATTVDGVEVAENALLYGAFIQSVIDFFIIAFCIFIFLRIITKAKSKFEKKVEEEAPAPAGPTTEELLTEIRDLLKNKE
ncbi:MAG: large-conductance mechanosensitive channel protein MscL [Clostridia bacterium]|nr:large-conductance mechanosensitive channel protein MscL [Clostridia bacterium]